MADVHPEEFWHHKRQQTPALCIKSDSENSNFIHLNAAGSSLISNTTLEAVQDFQRYESLVGGTTIIVHY